MGSDFLPSAGAPDEGPLLSVHDFLSMAKGRIEYVQSVHMTGLDLRSKEDLYIINLEKALDYLQQAYDLVKGSKV
jgi:hypothetical protein